MNQQPELESESLRSEIDSTRGRMDQTIDALENRLQGRHLLDEIVGFFRSGSGDGQVGEWREKIGKTASTVVDSVKAHPVPLLMIGAGIGWLIYQNRSAARMSGSEDQRDFDYTGEDYLSAASGSYGGVSGEYTSGASESGGQTSSFAGQAKEKLSTLGNRTRDKVSELTDRGREKLGSVRERASNLAQEAQQRSQQLLNRTRETVVRTADQHPLEIGIGFLALGVIAGMIIPTPDAVTRRLNPAASRLREASSDLVEKGKRVAKAAAEAAKVEAKTQGLTLERVRDKAGAVAQKAGEAAADTAKQERIPMSGGSSEDPSSAQPSV